LEAGVLGQDAGKSDEEQAAKAESTGEFNFWLQHGQALLN
jgi:hypothetical protein